MTQQDFLKLSLSRLYRLTKIHPSSWSRYFNGKRSMTMKVLERTAILVGMTPNELLNAIRERSNV